jgi:4'-phosphopantetheinyl transferase
MPVVEPGRALVFRLPLDLDDARLAGLTAILSKDESARAARFIPETSRRHFTAARGQMRQVLGALLGRDPAALRFELGSHGKPFLSGGELCFNLSHSGGLALLAVSANQEIGVDIEASTRVVEYENIGRRFFAPSEAAALLELPEAEHARAFFNIWTRKEAYMKACGLGMSLPLHSFTVSHDDPPTLSAEGWSIHAIDPGAGYTAALVVAGESKSPSTWDWRP